MRLCSAEKSYHALRLLGPALEPGYHAGLATRGTNGDARNAKIAAADGQAERLRAFCLINQANPSSPLNQRDRLPLSSSRPGAITNTRNQMRLFSLLLSGLLVTSAPCQSVLAQTPDCKSIADPAGRLACYDKSTPPVAGSAAARPAQRAVPPSKVDSGQYVDSIDAEDAIMKAKIKGICQGC